MSKKLFVGNLSWNLRDEDLKQLFAEFGELVKAEVVMDRFNPDRSRGYGFVEYTTDEAAAAAVKAINGKTMDGREIRVDEARENQAA